MEKCNIIIEKRKNKIFDKYSVNILIDDKQYVVGHAKQLQIELDEGLHILQVKTNKLCSRKISFEIKKSTTTKIVVFEKFSLSKFIISNSVVVIILLLSFFLDAFLRLFWLALAFNSSISLYYFFFKRNDFYNVSIKPELM